MKKIIAFVLMTLLVAALPVYASSVHLKGGKNAKPSFADNGLTLTAAGELSGLGNGDVLVTLAATGNPTAVCQNPSNDGIQEPPGQNPAPVTLTGTQAIPEDQVKNGNTPFGPIETDPPVSPIPGAPDCPNPNWTEIITDVAFTSAIITVEQPAGTTVLIVECTFDPATSYGTVAKNSVICTQTQP
jgi:hypothetical protein